MNMTKIWCCPNDQGKFALLVVVYAIDLSCVANTCSYQRTNILHNCKTTPNPVSVSHPPMHNTFTWCPSLLHSLLASPGLLS